MSDKAPKRSFLYHSSCREGRIFTEEDIEEKLEQGWVDTPTDLEPLEPESESDDTDSDDDLAAASDILEEAKQTAEGIIEAAKVKASQIEEEAVAQAEAIVNTAKSLAAGNGTDDPEWPQNRDGVWVDSAGIEFDPGAHSYPEGNESPSVNNDGTFRKLPAQK